MNLILITFSPTGGTLRCAEALAAGIAPVAHHIDLTSREFAGDTLTPDDVAIVAMPSYGGRVPPLAAQRLRMVKGGDAQCVLLAVFGNRAYEDTLVEMCDLARECGFVVTAAVTAIARHSIVHKIAAGRPDTHDIATLSAFGHDIAEKIASGEQSEPVIPGSRPYRKAGAAIAPKTGKACNACGVCAKQCPSGAIDPADPRRLDAKVCINCMRCVEICPTGAKHIPAAMLWLVGRMLKKPCASRKAPDLFI